MYHFQYTISFKFYCTYQLLNKVMFIKYYDYFSRSLAKVVHIFPGNYDQDKDIQVKNHPQIFRNIYRIMSNFSY